MPKSFHKAYVAHYTLTQAEKVPENLDCVKAMITDKYWSSYNIAQKSDDTGTSTTTYIIIAAAAGGAALILAVIIIYCCCCRKKGEDSETNEY